MKKTWIVAAALALGSLAGAAQAANADCEAKATEKKLAGAAKNSFMKKCEKDAASGAPVMPGNAECDAKASEKKLAGAAKASFLKKCNADAAKK